jgi:DNA-binding transcriptional LysR family regulator
LYTANPNEVRSMTDLDVRKLRVLQELAERGTVIATAEALHLTPSAVSQQLATLSREVGVKLIEPVGRGVRLTDAARVLTKRADEIFTQLEIVRADMAAYADGCGGPVRVAGFAATISGLALPALCQLRHTHPGIALRLTESDPPESFSALLRGDIDLVLSLESMDAPAASDRRFHRTALLAERLDVALPRDHPLAYVNGLRLADLAEEPWIFSNSKSCRDASLAVCTTAGFTPSTVHLIDDWGATLAAVKLGLGVALLPRLIRVSGRDDVVVRELDGQRPARHVFAAVRRGSEGTPHVAAVLDALRSVALDQPDEVPDDADDDVVSLHEFDRKVSLVKR